MLNLELPDLPYSKDALTPYMSSETLELHHDKHHMAYVTNGNKFIKENNFNEESIEEIVKNSYNKSPPVFNNVSQHLNHMHFFCWNHLAMKVNTVCGVKSSSLKIT